MEQEVLVVNANISITPTAIKAIVANAKAIVGKDENGRYRVDTADKVSEMVSLFLEKMNFEGFVQDIDNYK